jgi:hypothetical protein
MPFGCEEENGFGIPDGLDFQTGRISRVQSGSVTATSWVGGTSNNEGDQADIFFGDYYAHIDEIRL